MQRTAGKKLLLALALFFSFVAPADSSAQEIEITRAAFCLDIKDREPIDTVTDRVALSPNSELFFWIELQGGKEALQTLETTGQLLVKHQWRRGIFVTDTIEVGITVDKWREYREAIRRQIREQGFFTYRTYSYKANLENGKYILITLDNRDNAVSQFGSGRAFRPQIVITKKKGG